jgi:GNAT superfamily N-acetyltransferase
VELGKVGAAIWKPRVRTRLSDPEELAVYSRCLRSIMYISATQGMHYVESILKDGCGSETIWRAALQQNRFRLVASKCEWTTESRWSLRTGRRVRVRRIPAGASIIATLFRSSIVGSADRTTVYEMRFGEGLGPADLVLVANVGRINAGLCACLHEVGAPEAWIKYVGTVPGFRRHGAARSLLVEALNLLSHAGAKTIKCLIDAQNTSSTALHRKVGFKESNTCGDFYYRTIRSEL